MKITEAKYGAGNKWRDVLPIIGDASRFQATNQFFGGDPFFGREKSLKIKYKDSKGNLKNRTYKENDHVKLQDKSNRILGIFYTNNNVPKRLLEASLESVKIAANNADVDVIVCSWKPIANCPFHRIKANMQQGKIVNMYFQIAQLLNYGANTGEYEHVAFLEHDVLYPPDYFDFPKYNNVLYNRNNITFDKDGGHEMEGESVCMHQLVMKFPFAEKHIKDCLYIATSKYVVPEPNNHGNYKKRFTKFPAIHVNHGNHLSVTHKYYKKESMDAIPYWEINYEKLTDALI